MRIPDVKETASDLPRQRCTDCRSGRSHRVTRVFAREKTVALVAGFFWGVTRTKQITPDDTPCWHRNATFKVVAAEVANGAG